MNIKNILIAFGVIGIGVILYKVLLGFVLPIALFVSLGYILKFLLKGSDSDQVQKVSQVLTSSDKNNSSENIVEIKPIEEATSAEGEKSAEEENPSGGDKPFN